MRLNQKVTLFIVALPFCAALTSCADTIVFPTFEPGVVQPATGPAPIVKAPIYKNGEWWKVKTEVKPSGSRTRWRCHGDYSDYLLEIQEGKPKLYGINGTDKEEFDCPAVEDVILGKITRRLKFPLRVGNHWTHRILREGRFHQKRFRTVEYKVLGWEKVHTPKGVFEAFKLTRYFSFRLTEYFAERIETYYYSPKVKAIILRKHIALQSGSYYRERTYTVVDFNVRN